MILLCKFNFISAAAKERFLRFRTLPTTIHNLNKEGLQETIVNRTLLRRTFIAFAKAVLGLLFVPLSLCGCLVVGLRSLFL